MFEILPTPTGTVKAWTRGVPVDPKARDQLTRLASLPIVFPHVAVMPDVHVGIGATVGSVVPTRAAIIPSAVGVDIGCGMMAARTSLKAEQLPDSLRGVRTAMEAAIPHGRTHGGQRGDRGAWSDVPDSVGRLWADELAAEYARIAEKHPRVGKGNDVNHLGTLGTGNHFVEVCLDEDDHVWVMLHSGSRGVGNRIGTWFIELARTDLGRKAAQLPDADLAWFDEGTPHFEDYVAAVDWAQRFASLNRAVMMERALSALRSALPAFQVDETAVNCHHNYVAREEHFGAHLWVTRKGAVRARQGDLGIIPGSMGTRSYIVRGKGEPASFCSCSHGAGRTLSRTEAKRRYSVEDQVRATAHVECRKDEGVIDEIPYAYKDIDAVMAAQADLVEVVHTLRQVVCVKG